MGCPFPIITVTRSRAASLSRRARANGARERRRRRRDARRARRERDARETRSFVSRVMMRLDALDDDDDDDLFAAVDVDAVAARATASRALASSTGWNRASRPTEERDRGTTMTKTEGTRLEDVPLRARADAMRRDRGEGQLTVTSMFAAARGERARPTTVVGEVRETMRGDGESRRRRGGEETADEN